MTNIDFLKQRGQYGSVEVTFLTEALVHKHSIVQCEHNDHLILQHTLSGGAESENIRCVTKIIHLGVVACAVVEISDLKNIGRKTYLDLGWRLRSR